MEKKNGMLGQVDFVSFFAVHGWFMDEKTRSFPKNFTCVSENGASKDDYGLSTYPRIDVNSEVSCPVDAKLGFTINLFDMFNRRVSDCGIKINGRLVWTMSSSFAEGIKRPTSGLDLPNESGQKQVIIAYNSSDSIEVSLRQLVAWQPRFFSKKFNSGVSYKALSLDSAAEYLRGFTGHSSVKLITHSDYFERIVPSGDLSYTFLPPILLGKKKSRLPGDGTVQSIESLFDVKVCGEIGSQQLLSVFSAISGYSDLFFPSPDKVFTFKGGSVQRGSSALIKGTINSASNDDVVLSARQKIVRLSDIDDETSCAFVSLSSLHRVMDIMPLCNRDFIEVALKRGLKVKFAMDAIS